MPTRSQYAQFAKSKSSYITYISQSKINQEKNAMHLCCVYVHGYDQHSDEKKLSVCAYIHFVPFDVAHQKTNKHLMHQSLFLCCAFFLHIELQICSYRKVMSHMYTMYRGDFVYVHLS